MSVPKLGQTRVVANGLLIAICKIQQQINKQIIITLWILEEDNALLMADGQKRSSPIFEFGFDDAAIRV